MVRFSARSLAESPVLDCGIAVAILQCSRRTLIVSEVAGMTAVGSMLGPHSDGHMTLSNLCSWSLEYGLQKSPIRFRIQSLL
jgi:hypothetical protein